MAISKDKTRISITIHKRSKELLDEIISLHDPKINSYSVFCDLAIVYFYMAIYGYTNNDTKGDNSNA